MNILDLKRKALGHTLRWGDWSGGQSQEASGGGTGGYTGGGGGNTPDYSTLEGIGIDPASVTAPAESPTNADIESSIGLGDNPTFGGWASAAPATAETIDAPAKKNLGYDFGIRPIGTTLDSMLASETAKEKQTRMSKVAGLLDNAGQIAINAMPGGSQAMTVAKALAAMDKGMSFFDAAKAAAFDIGGGMVAGKINSAVGQALGPDVSKAISAYNKFGSLANLANPGSAPAVNPGAQAVGYAREAFGVPTLSKPSGLTTPSGDPVQSYGGWSSGGGGGSSSVPASLPQAEPVSPAAALTGLNTNMRFNLADQAKRFRALAQQ